MKKYDITIYTDGGVRNNQSKINIGGYGVFIDDGESSWGFNGHEKNTTNNKMELTACIEALRSIENKALSVLVYTDSKYVCDGINKWIYGWIRRGWKTSQYKPVKNKELWVELFELSNQFRDIRFEWVKGHDGDEGNERADELANEAMDSFGQYTVYEETRKIRDEDIDALSYKLHDGFDAKHDPIVMTVNKDGELIILTKDGLEKITKGLK